MKTFLRIALIITLSTIGAQLRAQQSDEEALADFVEDIESGRDEAQQTDSSEEMITERTEIETTEDGQTVITTTTVTTTVINNSNTATESSADTEVNEGAPEEMSPELNISGEKPLSVGTLIMAETLGLIVPGSGLAHFTLGDKRGGQITLLCTGIAALTYLGAEVALETRAIDGPSAPAIYGALHYGSMALFLAGYLYDLIGAPIYYKNYNARLNTTVSLRPLAVEYKDYYCEKDEINLNLMRFGLKF